MLRRSVLPVLVLSLAACRAPEGRAEAKPAPAPSNVPAPSAAAAPTPAPSTSAASAPEKPKPDGPRVYAKSRFVWIHPEPNGVGWTGYLWFGGSVKLRDPEPKPGAGCPKWVAIEPRGWVCADGERATLDPDDPVLKKIVPYAPNLATPWPHQYAESRNLYRYSALPKQSEQRMREWELAEHLGYLEEAKKGGAVHKSIVGVDLTPSTKPGFDLNPVPSTVHEPRTRLQPLSTVAYSTEVDHEGRTFLLSADLLWVAKDRVVPYPKVTFEGVHLAKGAKVSLAFFRSQDRGKFKLDGERLVETGERWPRLSHVELTGTEREQDSEKFLETKDAGFWVKKSDAVIPKPMEKTPWGAPVGGADTAEGPAGRRTWMQASVWQGWLIAYEGTQPVFVTLMSPGRGGTPRRGIDPIETASTPTGTFKITGKFATATMVAPGDFVHSDVPWTQNFSGPHALHGAYWHDDWGNRKSGGCVNVSPIDGKWLYEFTDPPAPEGWHGVRWRPDAEPATTFIVHD